MQAVLTCNDQPKFQHLECVGKVRHTYPLGTEEFSQEISPYMEDYPHKDTFIQMATSRPVKVNYTGYWKSVQKMDYPKEFKPDLFHDHALSLSKEYLKQFYARPLLGKISAEWDKSAGYPWKTLNCKTKQDAIKHRNFANVFNAKPTPIWVLAGKGDEKLDLADLRDNKMRTFQIAPLEFVIKQKQLFTTAQMAMVNNKNHWIKYGMCLQYGGIQGFFRGLSKYSLRWESDVSGWDRKLQIMDDVYDLKYSLMEPFLSEGQKDDFWHVADGVINSVFLTHDGRLYRRSCGNPSGSGSTTEDNCVAHVIIMMRFLSKLYYDYTGSLPTLGEILSNSDIGLFGDDNTGGINDEFFGVSDEVGFKSALIANYSFYSLIVKLSACKVEKGIGDCRVSFLGMRCLGAPGYNFQPNIGKVLSSLVYSTKKESFAIVCVRAIAIYRLLTYTAIQFMVREYLLYLRQCDEVKQLKASDPCVYEQLFDIDGPYSIYTGRECYFDFFSGWQKHCGGYLTLKYGIASTDNYTYEDGKKSPQQDRLTPRKWDPDRVGPTVADPSY